MIIEHRAGSSGDGVSFVDWNGAVASFFSFLFFSFLFFSFPFLCSPLSFDSGIENKQRGDTEVFISIVYRSNFFRSNEPIIGVMPVIMS